MSLIFKSFQPSPKKYNTASRTTTWIHSSGNIAAIIRDLGKRPQDTITKCTEFLNKQDTFLPTSDYLASILNQLHNSLRELEGNETEVTLVYYQNGQLHCAWVGHPRLIVIDEFRKGYQAIDFVHPQKGEIKLGMKGTLNPRKKTLPIRPQDVYMLSTCLQGDKLKDKTLEIELCEAKTNIEWQRIGEKTASNPSESEWAFLVFPVEEQFSYANPTWPYNPFVGPQEDLEHEKRGLAAIANALFMEPDFRGFKIIGQLRYSTDYNDSRFLDGMLVCPYGVVLLELKDLQNDVTISLTTLRQGMQWETSYGTKAAYNPIHKLMEIHRKFVQDFNLGVQVPTILRKIGAVIFTNPRANVTCIKPDNTASAIPLCHNEILVVTPQTLALTLKEYIQSKGVTNRISSTNIQTICTHLEQFQIQQKKQTITQQSIGQYLIDLKPDTTLSTDYYQVFHGTIKNRPHRIMAKRYPISPITRGKPIQEIERISREFMALQDLSLAGVNNVQKCLEKIELEDSVYIVLNEVEGIKLGEWLKKNPSREKRLTVLNKLAQTLQNISKAGVVHRSLSPNTIQVLEVDNKPEPYLVHFELCRLEYLATLPEKGRGLFDSNYQPREVQTPGDQVTSKSDIYSLGKIICFVLSGNLPFHQYKEHERISKQPGFWDNITKQCGLTVEGGRLLQRMMAFSPNNRPSPEEVVKLLAEWV